MSQGAGYFVAGWLTCAVMSGAILMLAVRASIHEDERQADDVDLPD